MKKILLILLLFSFSVNADNEMPDLEREALAKIIDILKSLDGHIQVAKENRNEDAVYRNHYEWLKQDILTIQLGVEKMLNGSTSFQPRIFKPLRGDYRR